MQRSKENLCLLYKELFDLKRLQAARSAGDDDGEILEYTKPKFNVELPDPKVILPREKPIPKPKAMSKWEKFRIERGLQARQKRSRIVYDPLTKDWVPRYGAGSVKKIQDRYNWIMEDKEKYGGVDPFTYAKQEKKLKKEKQNLNQLKNEIKQAQV